MSSYSFLGHTRTWTPREDEENRNIFSSQKAGTVFKSEWPPVVPTDAADVCEKWNIKRIILLLRLYGAHRCLWDPNDPDYRSREMRRAALVDIAAAMGDATVTQEQIVQKINVLRATYRYEKKRIKQRIKNGIGAKTKLKWFALADSFLRYVPKADKYRKSAVSGSDSDLDNTVVSTIDPETIIPFDEEKYFNDIKDEPVDFTYELVDEPSTAIKQESVCANITWTAKESLQFVELLSAQPTLWSNEFVAADAMHAMQYIAKTMQMPLSRIEKRVHIFRRTWKLEQTKIAQNPHYRPSYVWWHIVEKRMPPAIETHEIDSTEHFVDANEPPPPTPLNIYQLETKAETTSTHTTNVVTQTRMDDSLPSTAEAHNKIDTANTTTTTTTPTKLIWNGLEDDLLEGKWSLKHSVKFLRLYGAHRCLWDLNDGDFRSRELRNAAIEDMAAAMGHGLTADYVAKKIKIFRITYMQHRKRMLEAIKQGKQPEVQLRWFPLADSFLRPHIGLRCIKEHEREMPQFDFQYVYANLNLIDPTLLTDFRGKGTQNTIAIGDEKFVTPPLTASTATVTTTTTTATATTTTATATTTSATIPTAAAATTTTTTTATSRAAS